MSPLPRGRRRGCSAPTGRKSRSTRSRRIIQARCTRCSATPPRVRRRSRSTRITSVAAIRRRGRSGALRRCAVRSGRYRRRRSTSPIRPMPNDAYGYQDGYDEGAEVRPPSDAGGLARWRWFWRSRWWERGRPLPTGPMSDRLAAANRRSSRPTPARPRSCRRRPTGRQGAGPHGRHRRRREDRAARGSAGRRRCRPARGVSAAGSERRRPPSAASVSPNQPPTSGGNGTMPNNEPRKIKTLTVRGDQPDSAAQPVTPRASASAKPAPVSRTAPAPSPAAPAIRPRPMRAPMPRSRWSHKPPSRRLPQSRGPGWPITARHQPRPLAVGPDTWCRYPRNAAKPMPRPPIAPCRASSRPCSDRGAPDQARRSRRKGRLLPRHGGSIRLARGGHTVLR